MSIYKKYNADNRFTKFVKSKHYTKIYDNIPHNKNLNFMMDVLFLPTTKHGYKYLLVCVDLFTRQFDIEPLKNKDPVSVLDAFKKMIKRKYIKLPYYSIQTDNGGEFKGSFEEFLNKNNIYHKMTLPYRHQQNSMVENLNKQLGKLFNGYMNQKEEEEGKTYREWDEILDEVRIDLNKSRKFKPIDNQFNQPMGNWDFKATPKFKIGDVVYFKSEYPLNALGHKQNTANFRVGDYRYNVKTPRKIINIFYFGDKNVPFRYGLEDMKNVSYTENELILSAEINSKYTFERFLKRKKVQNVFYYLVKWKGYKISDSTWERRDNLISDGLENEIKDFDKNIKS